MRAVRVVALAMLVPVLAACQSSGGSTPNISNADALTALVDWQVGVVGPPTTDQPLPVVYITAEDGATIDAGTQAKVAADTVDTAKVRFADERADAIDAATEGKPVKDDGVLLIVDKFDGKGASTVPVGVTVYHDANDQQHLVMTVVATDDGAEVSSSSVRPSG